MSQQAEIDYDKQFQDDLAKATALSLEQQALDDYRRAKKYGTYERSATTALAHDTGGYYAQARRASRGHSSGEVTVPGVLSAPPVSNRANRRHSELGNVSAAVAAANARERSQTPPPAAAPTSAGGADNDLISFVSPDNVSIEKLIEDLHRMQTSNTQTALVPLGPTAAVGAHGHQGFVNATANLYGATALSAQPAVMASGPAGMQLVPYMTTPQQQQQQQQQQQKKPLTNEELQKLYNMPAQYSQAVGVLGAAGAYAHAHQAQLRIGFIAPPHYGHPYASQSAPPTAAAVSAAFVPPQYPNTVRYGFQYSANTPAHMYYAAPQVSTTTLPNMNHAAGVPQPPPPTTSSPSSSSSSFSTPAQVPSGGNVESTDGSAAASGSNANILRRQTPPATKIRNKVDLIDFQQEDDSRVSVLKAFDPLLNDDDGDSGDDASDCTSYYAEYDPFDYLYSGGGTQYSDPVYEAVHKLDKSAVSPNVSSIGWRQEYANADVLQQQQQHQHQQQQQQQEHESHTAEHQEHIDEEAARYRQYNFGRQRASTSSSRSPPPPLPPRNMAHAASSSGAALARSAMLYPSLSEYTLNDKDYAAVVAKSKASLDRRKTSMRLYEIVTDQRSVDPELLEFYAMVKDMRLRYLHDDDLTNVGHIIAAEFDYPYALETSIKIVVHPSLSALFPDAQSAAALRGQVKGYGVPVLFTCDITTAVELVISQAFCSLEGQIRGNVNDYAVKPIGVSEWLSPSSKLSQLECVHNCLKLERDVHLGLCPKTEDNMKVIARTQRDDMRDLRLEDIMPNETASAISYDNMMILIETLETEIDKLESTASEPSGRCILSCSGVVQAVKAIAALLGSIDTMDISTCIAELKAICEEGQKKFVPKSPTNPEIADDCGDYAEVFMRPRSLLEQIKFKCNQLRDAVQELIELYSNVFRVGFSVKTVDYTTTPIPISCVLKPIVVSINCLHRPPPSWKYDDYSLGVQINYGTRFISDPVVTKCPNDTSGGLFARLNFSSWITFDKNPICTLPREARLIFVLYGTQTPENEPTNTDPNGERKQITTELGWCAIQLFDYKREMICGPYLLSMWPPTTDKFLGPAPARGCHPSPDVCPVLSIEIPPYGGRIMFPEPLENPPPAPRFDFNSLDTNLQQELLDTAEQGYPGATDKREVFWEKRLYLQNFPNALPKVLHAAHSWDYASLMDLQSLLYSWTALSPLQALELLLPRYPDAKVRERAVEWISYLPNDQLVDYLPQLLQALKHDTYEASAMARFLLCKCLESPRIAHHMYWLLVHSLPGDDPQNSIDDASSFSTELDKSLITQCRYYRRNKMMLRALLAICGEKLTARFLRQNNMCRHLAKAAESVKEAKESLRQKALCYGMDTVHQDLLGEPTSLPLGPELEVTGVNVRNCSYFNSKTLPIKISYIGPDNELLPAIFKSGDDLQQDMLTIQLIRVMNKMWLAERLDLKIVTFNCVPTGHKKGMIQLVSDAETLRKIQVEYGLTGSFKDRPIAEWLAKQNPSQLEYQRAVKNFTVSCAGYSVATYILGICDRHNDNIMLKTSGHLFHIDFGKFLGDAQMFGNIKRDRTPFVLTSDMAYVINGGDKPSTDFHYFVDLCCRAFNIIRKHGDLILHMLALMATAGIPGVTADAVTYVRRALLPSQSNPEAAASFAKMIQFSLNSWFTQLNFFFHNLAQMRSSNDDGGGELLSFVPRKYTMQQDGRLKSVRVVRCQKHYDMEKYYTYILEVTRHGQPVATHLFRSYKEFTEFHQKLCIHYPLAKLHSLPTGLSVGRSNVKSVAEKRLPEIQEFLISLFNSSDEIAHSDLVYTFFHPLLRDQQKPELNACKVREVKQITHRDNPYEVGQIKLSLQYRRGALTVMIHHAKCLPMLQGGQEPNTYVKCYLKPDATKMTKRKTKVVRKTCVPSFMEALEYRMPIEHIQHRVLHVTVWSHDTLQENELLGGFQIDLGKYDLCKELIDWFPLGPMARH